MIACRPSEVVSIPIRTLTLALFATFAFATLVPTAAAGLPEPQCMDRYWELDAGVVRIVSPDSCTYYVYPGVDITSTTSGPDCMYRYWEQSVGDFTIVSRSTCQYEVYYKGQSILR